MELSKRWTECLRALPNRMRPGSEADCPVFLSPRGERVDYKNFRERVWLPLVRPLFPKKKLTIHGLRHTWASLHLLHGSPIPWIVEQGGWASAQMLLTTYGHFIKDRRGLSDVLSPGRIQDGSSGSERTDDDRRERAN